MASVWYCLAESRKADFPPQDSNCNLVEMAGYARGVEKILHLAKVVVPRCPLYEV